LTDYKDKNPYCNEAGDIEAIGVSAAQITSVAVSEEIVYPPFLRTLSGLNHSILPFLR